MHKYKKSLNTILSIKKSCPVCHRYYFNSINSYEICPICKWEDDPIQRKNPNYSGGANTLSLNDYKKAYEKKN